MPTYELKRFRVSSMANNSVVFLVARRGSGKSTNCIGIFSSKRSEFSYGIAFVGNKNTIADYAKIMPQTFIYENYQPEVLKDLIDHQERIVAEKGRKNTPYVYVIVDDCFWQKGEITNDAQILRLLNNGRHFNIFFVLSMHYSLTIKPMLRQQVDYVFLSYEKVPLYRERLYKNYNVAFKTQHEFDLCMMTATKNYGTLVLDNHSSQSDKLEDNVFWWKSRALEDGGAKFKVNKHGTWWKYHKLHFDPQYYLKPDSTASTKTKGGKRGKKDEDENSSVHLVRDRKRKKL